MRSQWPKVILSVLPFVFLCGTASAYSEATCVRAFYKSSKQTQAAGIAANDIDRLIVKIAIDIGLSSRQGIVIVPCNDIDNVKAYVPPQNMPDVPYKEYIIYSPKWVQNVIGADRTQAVALFGHELGHLVGRHLTTRPLSVRDQETEADGFAGCAVAKQRESWSKLEDLLLRIRDEVSTGTDSYPSQKESIAAARTNFLACGGSVTSAALEKSTKTINKGFPSYKGPPLIVSAADLTQNFPSGKWGKSSSGQYLAWSINTNLYEMPMRLTYYFDPQTKKQIIIFFQMGDNVPSLPRVKAEEICAEDTFTRISTLLERDVGPLLRPVKEQNVRDNFYRNASYSTPLVVTLGTIYETRKNSTRCSLTIAVSRPTALQ